MEHELDAMVVHLPALGGRGVLVPGGLILTAAHCLVYDNDIGAKLALGDHWPVEVTASDGTNMWAQPRFIEAIADIAVLGSMDSQDVSDTRCKAFESFVENTQPVPLWKPRHLRQELAAELRLPIRVMSLSDGWTDGQAIMKTEGFGAMYTRCHLGSGTSGGPILTWSKELVGLVSSSEATPKMTAGDMGMPKAWAEFFGPSKFQVAASCIPPRIAEMMDGAL